MGSSLVLFYAVALAIVNLSLVWMGWGTICIWQCTDHGRPIHEISQRYM